MYCNLPNLFESKFGKHLIYVLFSFAYGYNFKYFVFLFHMNISLSQLQSPRNFMVLPPHIKDAAHVMACSSTMVFHQRSQRLVWLAYVNNEAEEGNEEDSENE